MTMNNIEQYQNLILLIEPILKFYADYDKRNMEIDKGFQAAFALSKIEELLNSTTSLEDDLNNKIAEMTGIVDNLDTMTEDEILNALKSLK